MRLTTSLPTAILIAAAADVTMAIPSASITTTPTTSDDLKTFTTTASNCTDAASTGTIQRRDTELITSAPAATATARPSVFTSVTCLGNFGEEDGYVKHRCRMYEYKLKELESGAGISLPMLGGLWAMAGLTVITMLL
ncbi:hypothetical protein B0T20DRAFT_455181 [Sordaria brevicollis]|uniref:Uncharacterized protein n=1 Tax=Sordaria brevicollis TaxID=83679 RepID=A0AAE0PB30_SORBR|nr:hypothetical protein B0T20DRAFT_455181 [Sordaria brevicollis]